MFQPLQERRSAIYEGWIQHCRYQPKQHRFRYPIFMMYLDLQELDEVFEQSGFWSMHRPALARFKRDDFLPGHTNLDTAVRDWVEQQGAQRPEGPICLLAHLRYFGYVMNPLSCYYCFDKSGQNLQYLVAEVHNTPWGEVHRYLLPCLGDAEKGDAEKGDAEKGDVEKGDVVKARSESESDGKGGTEEQRFEFDKAFHVSPFNPMDMCYHWRSNTPGQTLRINLQNWQESERIFSASLSLTRREISTESLNRVLWKFPLMTGQVIVGIYWQALKLAIKGVPFYAHSTAMDMESRP